MIKILFICHGNICRSPTAEFVMKKLVSDAGLSDKIHVESAAATREDIGSDIYPSARKKLTAEGIPFTHRAARQMTRADYDRFDYIIGMDSENLHDMRRISGGDRDRKISLMLDLTQRRGSNVADPWYTGNFDEAFEDIMEGCTALLEHIESYDL